MTSHESSSAVPAFPRASATSTDGSDEHPRSRLSEEEHTAVRRWGWRAPAELAAAPGPEKVLPQLSGSGIRIECVSRRPLESLGDRMEQCRLRQRESGRVLASTFCHGGSLFMVFKHWPPSADTFPRSI